MNEHIFGLDELREVSDDKSRLDLEEAAAYLACVREGFDEIIMYANDPDEQDWFTDDNTGNIEYCRQKAIYKGVGYGIVDDAIKSAIQNAITQPYTNNGRDFSLEQIRNLPPETGIWFLHETFEWCIGRPTWVQVAKNLRLRVYIRIS